MKLSIGWWNTSLSPAAGKPAPAKDVEFAIKIIASMLHSGVDVLGLAEVGEQEISEIGRVFGPMGYGVQSAVEPCGRSRFDMAMIYRIAKVSCVPLTPWAANFEGRTFKLGVPLNVHIGGDTLLLILSHWPGRRFFPENDKMRFRIAVDVRSRINEFMRQGRSEIVLIGDLNDEPHTKNVCEVLGALRDRSSASALENYFYNPYWNFLGSMPSSGLDASEVSRSGTYYYKKDATECWWTFDQMIFSSNFLGTGSWALLEELTSVYSSPELEARLRSPGKFDHLPIVSTIARKPQ